MMRRLRATSSCSSSLSSYRKSPHPVSLAHLTQDKNPVPNSQTAGRSIVRPSTHLHSLAATGHAVLSTSDIHKTGRVKTLNLVATQFASKELENQERQRTIDHFGGQVLALNPEAARVLFVLPGRHWRSRTFPSLSLSLCPYPVASGLQSSERRSGRDLAMKVDDMNRKEGDGMDIDIVSPSSSPHLPSVHEHEPTSFSTALSQPVHPHSHPPPHPGNPNSFYATATASPSPSAPHPSSPSQAAAFPGPGRRSGVTRPLAAYKEYEQEHKDNSETRTKPDIDRKGWPSSSSSPPPRGDHQQHSPVSPEQEADSSETSERTRTAQIILSLAASASASDSARNSSAGGFGPRSLPPPPLALGASSSASRTGAGGKDEKHTGPSEFPGDRSKEASLGRPRGEKEASSPTSQSFLRLVQEAPYRDTAATKTLALHGGQQLALGQPLRAFLDLAILSEHGVDLGPAYTPQSSSLPLASASTLFFRLPSASNSLSSSGRARPTPIPLTLAGAHRHSPYPPSSRSASFHLPATATGLPPMPVSSGASGPPSTPSRSASHAGGQSQAQFTPPSMSSSARRRRGPVPDWPSPKAISPGQSSAYGSSRGDGSAAAFALQTPTPLRVPQSAALRSPALTAQHSAIRPPPPPLPPVYHYAAAPRSAPLRERQHRGIAASAPVPSSPRVAAPLPIPATPRTPASAQRARLVQRSPTMASVVKELNGRAGDYWTSPESADVRISESALTHPLRSLTDLFDCG